jgi:CRP/FNR family transcriptional regulator, cyclic AMP receptor protein
MEGNMTDSVLPPENLFAELPTELSRRLKAPTTELAADQTLFIAGDAGGCYRVENGLLKASVFGSGGSERILAIFGPGSMVGELLMIDGAPRSASVAALRPSRLSLVSRASFDALGRSNPDFYRLVMTLLARRLRQTNVALAAASFLPVKGRIARVLVGLADAFGKDVGSGRTLVQLKLTQSDLAAMAGLSRENASRILKEWMDRALVSRLAGYYCLENRAAIAREGDL